MNTRDRSSSKNQPRGSLFHRLDIRLPWLKLVTVLVVGLIIILDLTDFTISKLIDPYNKIKTAPMSHHVKATERDPTGKMLVALTFDDGPSPENTPRLLDILTEKDVSATFFMLGFMARDNPGIVQRVARERHDVASHTMYHQNLVNLSPAAAEADINEANATFNAILGHGSAYTRPPYGNINGVVANSIKTPMVLWSVDTEDWRNKDPNAIIATTMSEVHDGAIILMHDIYPSSVDTIPALVDTLRRAGYEFVTISELAKLRGIQLIPGVAYYNLTP